MVRTSVFEASAILTDAKEDSVSADASPGPGTSAIRLDVLGTFDPVRRRGGMSTDRFVLILDPEQSSRIALCRSFEQLGFSVTAVGDLRSAMAILPQRQPGVLITELRLGAEPRGGVLAALEARKLCPSTVTVIATAYGAISSAIMAVRSGVDSYLTKPVTAEQVLQAISGRFPGDDAEPFSLTLHEAKWEYINMVLDSAGSIARAARLLGLDRRSLRRMLSKYAPRRAGFCRGKAERSQAL